MVFLFISLPNNTPNLGIISEPHKGHLVQNISFFGRGFCEGILRPYWVMDVEKANTIVCR